MRGSRPVGVFVRTATIVLWLCLCLGLCLGLAAVALAQSTQPATRPAARAALPNIGDTLEVKWGGLWRAASVKNRSPQGWILVEYDKSRSFEWVEPWRTRKTGAKTDDLPYATPNKTLMKPEPPPAAPPALAPTARAEDGQNGEVRAEKGAAPTTTPAPEVSGGNVVPAKPQAAADADPLPVSRIVNGAPPTALKKDAIAWSLPLDPINPVFAPTSKTLALQGGSREMSETAELILPHGPSSTALIAYVDATPGKPTAVRCERTSLLTGVSMGTIVLPVPSVPMDLSPNGQLLLTREYQQIVPQRSRLDLWTLAANASTPPKHYLSFKPYDGQKWPALDPAWAAFADDAHVLTLNYDGHLILWDISAPQQVKALWSIALATNATKPVFSPGGKYLAVVDPAGILFLDPLQGTLLARLPSTAATDQSLAFSPDGKLFAAQSGQGIRTWDLSTGKLLHDLPIPPGNPGGPIDFTADPNYLLLGGGHRLLDLARQIVLWDYEDAPFINPPAAGQWGGRFWHLVVPPMHRRTESSSLASAVLPHPAALQLAATLKPDELFLIKPGVTVSLELNIEATEEQKQKVIAALTAKLKQIQVSVADAPQPIKLIATTTLGQSQTRNYEQIGVGAKSETVTITPHITRLAFETADGKTAWSTSTTESAGLMLLPKDGQSAQSAADAASQYNIPFLINCAIPGYVAKPHEPYGKSPLP